MKVHILKMVLALLIFVPMVLVPVRSALSHINGHTQMGTVVVDILDVNVSHNATYLGATISVHVTVEITWDVFDFSSGYVDALYDGNLIERKIFYVIWQGHTIDYLVFDWNTSGVGMGSHSISAVAVGTNIDTYADGTVQILPIGNLNTKGGYQTIQEAINDANDGDTIFVKNGTYCENVVIDKEVTIFGESREGTVIDGNYTGHTVYINASNVAISELMLCKGLDSLTLIYCNNTSIHDVKFSENWGSVFEEGCWFTDLSDNWIENPVGHSILLKESFNNTIINNSIAGQGGYGIYLFFSSNNTIEDNSISHQPEIGGVGVKLEHSMSNLFENNTLSECRWCLVMETSAYNRIFHSNFLNSSDQISLYSSPDNLWDNGCEGNYWSEYDGTDVNGDGIGDLPYVIDENNADRFPLMNRYWNPSDINHDLKIDIKDVARAAMAYGTQPIDPLWNPHADITGPEYLVPDNKVDIRDVSLIARHFGEMEG